MAFCPNCRADFPPPAVACPHCGLDLVDALQDAPQDEAPRPLPEPPFIVLLRAGPASAGHIADALAERGIRAYLEPIVGIATTGIGYMRVIVSLSSRDAALAVIEELRASHPHLACDFVGMTEVPPILDF